MSSDDIGLKGFKTASNTLNPTVVHLHHKSLRFVKIYDSGAILVSGYRVENRVAYGWSELLRMFLVMLGGYVKNQWKPNAQTVLDLFLFLWIVVSVTVKTVGS